MGEYYVYCYLDPRKPGKYQYGEFSFDFEPFYIGKGKGDRIKKHLMSHELFNKSRIRHNRLKNSKINSIKSDGLVPIYSKIAEDLQNEDASALEIKLISIIGRKIKNDGPLCNISDGGDGGDNMKYLDPDRKKEIYDRLSTLFKGTTYKGPDRGHKVYQYDLDGNFIKEWPSIRKVSDELGIHRYTITQNMSGKGYKSAGGFIFKKEKLDKIPPLSRNIVPVFQYNLDGDLIKEWDSMQKAANSLDLSISGISLCCSGEYRHCGGFKWKYK